MSDRKRKHSCGGTATTEREWYNPVQDRLYMWCDGCEFRETMIVNVRKP